ncbi:SDR family NAD(P)-dependent oxidoreductase [Planomonospora venezuelensis]|uniref:3alpha(Or 20beta)-hydroxysteroid dehydrogenase n=1 Tax=Planomonospora venezuelensis TaxID=1999 RepID=A0A841D8C3_PLAVE|nr:glucose 1-dehydrogenase [Planomonospora venezuelensis]MBB5966451.1 3alpha(or 20beta)-hydroxysteroid dehydrogenase [Planomonospora venezuelensis]GIN04107.1 3-alpha-(or 20-beta)-hydroxysteroid dehydrogenase [Planomonospora venezuelensis]
MNDSISANDHPEQTTQESEVPSKDRLLEGKVAIVTGAARGQGASHAKHLAQEGAYVLLTDILDDLGKTVAQELRDQGHQAGYARLDVRDSSQWNEVVAELVKTKGSLDILVNNAGVCEVSAVEECSDAEWALVMETNAGGVLRGCRSAIPAMKATGGGVIVNTASVQAVKGTWGYAAYQASKAAVVALTRSMAITYAKENIRVNAIAPSAVNTEMLKHEMEHFATNEYFDFDTWLWSQPISRVAEPEEVSKLVVFLVSDLSAYSTGGVFPVDGGLLAG